MLKLLPAHSEFRIVNKALLENAIMLHLLCRRLFQAMPTLVLVFPYRGHTRFYPCPYA